MDDIVFTLDRHQQHTGVFGGWIERFGIEREVFIGKTASEIHGIDAAHIHEEAIERALKGEQVVYEWSMANDQGEFHFQTSLSPIRNQTGDVTGLVGVGRDVTERKLIEEAKFRLAAIVESSEDAIISKNLDRVITSWNAGAEQLFGYTEQEAVGQPITFLIPPDLRDEEEGIVEKLRTGEPIDHCETVRVTKAGKRVDVSLSISPVKDSTGRIVGFSKIARDITQRKRAEEALRESEERFHLAAQAGKVYAYEYHAPTHTVVRSPEYAKILGLTAAERFTYERFLDGVHPADRSSFLEAVAALTPENPTSEVTYRFLCPNGGVVWLKSSGRGFFDSEQKLVRVVGMVADVTEHKLAEEAMSNVSSMLIQAQERERTRIGRELHDDINQRLAMLAVELEQLADDPSTLRKRVQELRSEVAEISNDVQALSHELHSSKLEYLGVVAGMKSWCKEFADHQNMEIDFGTDVARPLPLDIGLCLFRVLQEALHNAIKHSGVKQVHVELAESSNEWLLTISDSGVGFELEAAKQGRGLGLTSMQERVRLVNGTITVESKLRGGTTIHVRVPFNSEHASRQAAS
jgi:PAS domain S-box-containing protein